MTMLADADLPTLPVESPAFDRDPMPFVEAARARHPWLARMHNGYVVHGYQAMKEMIAMDGALVPAFAGIVELYGGQGTPWARFMTEMLIGRSGPDHTRIRAAVAEAFTPRTAKRFTGQIQQVLIDLLDEWAPAGRMDFADVISHFPVRVLAKLLGARTDPMGIRENLEVQVASITLDPSLLPELLAGYDILYDYVHQVIVDRETQPGDDDGWVDSMIAARNDGRIDDTELHFLLMMLFPAGYDTSKNMIGMTIHTLLQHPQHWARCAEDRAFCTKVVEEMFRYAAVAPPMRIVAQPFDYGGFHFEPGTIISFATAITGRDPAVFEDPLTFDPEREHRTRHVGFGRGEHICLGMHLARLQIEEAVHLCTQRMRNPRLDGEVTWRSFMGVWGPRSLPIAFDPGEIRPSEAPPAKAAA